MASGRAVPSRLRSDKKSPVHKGVKVCWWLFRKLPEEDACKPCMWEAEAEGLLRV